MIEILRTAPKRRILNRVPDSIQEFTVINIALTKIISWFLEEKKCARSFFGILQFKLAESFFLFWYISHQKRKKTCVNRIVNNYSFLTKVGSEDNSIHPWYCSYSKYKEIYDKSKLVLAKFWHYLSLFFCFKTLCQTSSAPWFLFQNIEIEL